MNQKRGSHRNFRIDEIIMKSETNLDRLYALFLFDGI